MTEQKLEELIRKYAEGTASEMEKDQLQSWYRSAEIEDVNWPAGDADEKEHLRQHMLTRLQEQIKKKPSKVVKLSWLRVAAVLLLVAGIALIATYFSKTQAGAMVTIANPSGKIITVILPDSSHVWLNAATTLRYEKSFAKNRNISLDGEAYFEVTHDKHHPFTVSAGTIQTTVLGTSFNIKAYNEAPSTIVSLLTGRVAIADSIKDIAVLNPGTQLQFDRANGKITTVNFDSGKVLGWRSGQLQFAGETFGDIATALENWYGIRIHFTNEQLKQCRYYLNFETSSALEKVLSLVREVTGSDYKLNKQDNTLTFLGKGCN